MYIQYVPNQLVEILQTNCFVTFGLFCISKSFLTCAATRSFHTNVQELV